MSIIGYLHYGPPSTDVWLPITDIRLVNGEVVCVARYTTRADEEVTIASGSPCTLIGVDGSQIWHKNGTPNGHSETAAHGGVMTVTQAFRTAEVIQPPQEAE